MGPTKSFSAIYVPGIAGMGEVQVQVSLLVGEEGPFGFKLKQGIETILAIENEQVALVQVFQATRTLAI